MSESMTTIERLGFAAGTKVAVVHADDIGMCHAANEGAFAALEAGPMTCGSIMVPCPWFAEAAARARAAQDAGGAHDLGVHLTLNAEWEHYRWGPVAGVGAVPSLVGTDGGFYRTLAETWEKGLPEEVDTELRAQIDRALAAGIDVTHIDSHMGTVFGPQLIEIYAQLARDYRLPLFVLRTAPSSHGKQGVLDKLGLPRDQSATESLVAALEAEGFPVFDHFDFASLDFAPGDGEAHNAGRLAGLTAGLNYLITHPARGGDELSAIAPEAHCRDFERGFYGGPAGSRALAEAGIETVGMRALRDLVRA